MNDEGVDDLSIKWIRRIRELFLGQVNILIAVVFDCPEKRMEVVGDIHFRNCKITSLFVTNGTGEAPPKACVKATMAQLRLIDIVFGL